MNNDLISREALMKFPIRIDHYDKEHGSLDFVLGVENVLEYAESLPAVDAVEVVRCYQCKYYLKSPMICEREDGLWTPDKLDYCSFGERWDGE